MEDENTIPESAPGSADQLHEHDLGNPEVGCNDAVIETTHVAESETSMSSPNAGSESSMVLNETSRPLAPLAKVKQQTMHMRTGSFQKWKKHMQRAWRWGPAGGSVSEDNFVSREETAVNFEAMANQKREWYQINSKSLNDRLYKEPDAFFEHFFIVGLHSFANIQVIENAFAKRKAGESNLENPEILDLRNIQHHGAIPTLEPQVLFKYPPGKKADIGESDLPAFCFPDGVKARLIERTPSMSELNEVVFGQEHLSRDDQCFIFRMKVADNATLYGVCLQVQEIVQRAPGILGPLSPVIHNAYSKPSSFQVTAPRCYCLLTKVPFFELHYEMLNSIVAQERLDRITQFAKEIALARIPLSLTDADWNDMSGLMYSPGPASTGGTSSSTSKSWPESPGSFTTSATSETFESRCDSFDRVGGVFENLHGSPDSMHSTTRGGGSDEDEDDMSSKEIFVTDEKVMEWAKANNNDPLQIVCGYHLLPLPSRGREIIFHPVEHLQPINYRRADVSFLGLGDIRFPSLAKQLSFVEKNEVNLRLAAAEEALVLSVWSVSTLCRSLSLENVLALFAGALLEKQMVVICPNLGILSAVILSIIPMIRPFEWQSLFLPILPRKMFDLLDAPVPFIAGVTHKPTNLNCNIIRINLLKDKVKTCSLPQLPRYKELLSELSPLHAKISSESYHAQRHPIYRCSETQAEAAEEFLSVTRRYLESLCSEMRSHTITNVQSNNDRVSLLLKDIFIESFPAKDRPFVELFTDTQLFSVLSDSRLATFEAEQSP